MSPDALATIISRYPGLIVAVSGGVDSMTLASFAHQHDRRTRMVHAVSPAVPPAATQRVREMAEKQGWRLSVLESGEFADPRYRNNPVDRCYFCKTNLYQRIGALADGTIASGTNCDDLDDFRPGLVAARENNVIHPFVHAQMNKAAVRELARMLGLGGVAELPAQPCLASRVQTGIAISAKDLAFIDRVETAIREKCPPQANVRCRVTHHGIAVEVSTLSVGLSKSLAALVNSLCVAEGRPFVGVQPYRQGAMFTR